LRSTDAETQLRNEIDALTKELQEEKKKTRDFETLKKQAQQQADEYNRLADKYNELEVKYEKTTSETPVYNSKDK